jgi:hypothetical protein
MRMSRIPALFTTMVALVLLLAACGTADPDTADTDDTDTTDDTDAAEPADGEDYTLATVVKLIGVAWFDRMEEGVAEFGEDHGVTTFQQGPAQADAAQQVAVTAVNSGRPSGSLRESTRQDSTKGVQGEAHHVSTAGEGRTSNFLFAGSAHDTRAAARHSRRRRRCERKGSESRIFPGGRGTLSLQGYSSRSIVKSSWARLIPRNA